MQTDFKQAANVSFNLVAKIRIVNFASFSEAKLLVFCSNSQTLVLSVYMWVLLLSTE